MKSYLPYLSLLLSFSIGGLIDAENAVSQSALLRKLLINYDNTLVPGALTDQPTEVKVGMWLNSFRVNEEDDTALLSLYFRQSWVDPRLQFNESVIGTKDHLKILDDVSKIWIPDTFIVDEVGPHIVDYRMLKIRNDGDVFYTQRMITTVRMQADHQKYPKSDAQIVLAIESYGYAADSIVIREKTPITHILEITGNTVSNMALRCASQESILQQFKQGSFSRFNIVIEVLHLVGPFVKSIILPSILLVALSWTAFWLSPKSVSGVISRVLIGLVTILMLLIHLYGLGSPKTSYMAGSIRGLFASLTLLFNVAAFLESLVVIVLASGESNDTESTESTTEAGKKQREQNSNNNKYRRVDFFAKISFPIALVIFEVVNFVVLFSS